MTKKELEEKIKELKGKNRGLRKKNEELVSEIKGMGLVVVARNDEIQKLSRELRDCIVNDELRIKLSKKADRVRDLENEMADMKDEVFKLQMKNGEYAHKLKELNNVYETEKENAKTHIKSLEEKYVTCKDLLKIGSAEVGRLKDVVHLIKDSEKQLLNAQQSLITSALIHSSLRNG